MNGCTSDMLSKVPALVDHVSSIVSLEVGSSILLHLPPSVLSTTRVTG
jgi:2-keto-4-pentenoate hydratase/2-oxohepta-3-ene-1,7-dioic acid hydratase in catechol pathway